VILRCIEGPDVGREWELAEPLITIGRDPGCDITLNDTRVSRLHAELTREDGQFILRDRKSTNGLRVNNESVQSKPLVPGDHLVIGASVLQLVDEISASPPMKQERTELAQAAIEHAVHSLTQLMETRDPATMEHTQRTCHYALGIARLMSLPPQRLQRLRIAAQLHDIGKIVLQQELVNKPAALSSDESIAMREHVMAAARILRPIECLQDIIPIILGHHECWDGSGYPQGLKGEEILLESRILAVADSFDAMTTQRPYNHPLPMQDALKRCHQSAGKQFDPQVVVKLATFLLDEMHGRKTHAPMHITRHPVTASDAL